MGDLESLMGQTKALMGELITKPKMSDKLLGKPPFRFLHDTITSVISTTGFGEALYEGGELDSASITDKDAKINYLNKIFNLVGICKVTEAIPECVLCTRLNCPVLLYRDIQSIYEQQRL